VIERSLAPSALFSLLTACTSSAQPVATTEPAPSNTAVAASQATSTASAVATTDPTPTATASATAAASAPADIDGPITAGLRTFRGMVTPVKDGYSVRGIVLADSSLPQALAKSSVDGIPKDSEWFLGAVVRVTCNVVEHESTPPTKGGLAVQSHQGEWMGCPTVQTAEIVAKAVEIEGKLARSKGLFQIEGHLIESQDLDWALTSSGGAKEGMRVHLWGQPKVVHCEPNMQCLEGGSLPMFEVGRAKKL
jgi:hypothetical protein